MFISDETYFVQRILNTDVSRLTFTLANMDRCYHTFEIPKAGGSRRIEAIERNSALYAIQKSLCRNFLEKLALPTPVVGFVKEESYLSFLTPHIGKKYFLRLDIRDFFGAVSTRMVTAAFQEFFAASIPQCLETLAALCTHNGVLPQGAVTSPAVSNVVLAHTDQRILKYCQSFDVIYGGSGERLLENIAYTRYADDLLFSSNCIDFAKNGYFAGMIGKILKDAGFRLNRGKTKYGVKELTLSGYVLSDGVHLSREKLHAVNQLIYFFGKTRTHTDKKYRVRKALFSDPQWLEEINALHLPDGHGGIRTFHTPQMLLDYLCGYRALLISIRRANREENGHMRQLDRKIEKLEMIVDCILEHC